VPTTLSVENIFETVANEAFGFKFGKPDRPSENSLACILPILRETSQKRQYITLPETEELHITDSGSINRLKFKNTSKDNVFIRSASLFEGKGTQSRALSRSAVIFPGQEVSLEVRCVHASHGIRKGFGFEYGGVTPLSVDSVFYTSGFTPRDQHTMWSAVQESTNEMRVSMSTTTSVEIGGSRSKPTAFGARRARSGPMQPVQPEGTVPRAFQYWAGQNLPFQNAAADFVTDSLPGIGNDNLKANFDEFAQNFQDILSKARLHDHQVGTALITATGCKTIELFDLASSWEALHKDAVKRMGTELLRGPDNTNVFEYKPENAVNAVRAVLALPFKSNLIYEHKPSNGEPHVAIYGVTAKRFVGEVVELDGRVIHAVVLESEAAPA
jgi:hypothetical protein